MIVDAHAHIWKAAPEFPNPSVTIVSPCSDVPLELLRGYMDEHGVGRAVLVQPIYPGEDNSLVADAAASDPDRFAAVCVVDPNSSEAPDRLEYWVRERGCRGLRLRPAIAGEEAVFGDPRSFPLWERIRALGVVVNLLARREHLGKIGAMADRFGEVRLIVDHLAHPEIPEGMSAAPFQELLGLARRPNVSVKPTGFYYYSRQEYPYSDCTDFFQSVLQAFGPERLIWGSDFPHVLLKTGYRRSLHLFEREYSFLGASDRARILGGNAESLYWRLNR